MGVSLQIFGDLEAPYGLSLTPDFPIENKRMDGESFARLCSSALILMCSVLANPPATDPTGSELMTYQPISYGGNSPQVDLNQLLSDAVHSGKNGTLFVQALPQKRPGASITQCLMPFADDGDDHEPDYFSQDLNTPNVERKSISFRGRQN